MVLFNDPLPCPDPPLAAVRLAADLQTQMGVLADKWRTNGHQLGFSVGIAFGFATIGTVGFEGRRDYTAIGTVVNQASRLCAEAKAGETLMTQRVAARVEATCRIAPAGELTLKGLRNPLPCYRLEAEA